MILAVLILIGWLPYIGMWQIAQAFETDGYPAPWYMRLHPPRDRAELDRWHQEDMSNGIWMARFFRWLGLGTSAGILLLIANHHGALGIMLPWICLAAGQTWFRNRARRAA